ncbi:MAG: hypothetical protein K1000chlam3_01469, partial [Chlamydiae bacterium]|nr:hypothetical protein [Chlamydiota bacterium]
KNSVEYKSFWEKLNRGEFEAGEYKRIAKNGKEVWLQAAYNPIFDLNGKPFKVVKYATDMTTQKLLNSDYSGQISAISKSQAVIEFNMDGTIISANDIFLETIGYTLKEIQGKHHSMFVDEKVKNSVEYKSFWEKLNRGEFEAAEYKRIAKNGREIWLQAAYNPIFDLNGKPFKVVKYATDMTAQKLLNSDYSGQISAISKSQAVIEFNMDGTVIIANDNFLDAFSYTLQEVKGKHHSMFVGPAYKESVEYKTFWENLNLGVFEAGEYKRFGKNGKEVWIQAAYNPIFDLNGKPFKVVKFATDITKQKIEIETSKQEMKMAIEDLDYQNQIKSNVQELANSIRGELGGSDIGSNILSKLSKIINIQVGAFYIFNKDGHSLDLISSYAYKKRKNLSEVFQIGEGLVGQCAREKQTIVISNVPDDYIKVTSGLGEATPNVIMVMPIMFEEKLLAVLEIAKLGTFSDGDIKFIEASGENIAVVINSAEARKGMQGLVEETRKQASELQEQQEELKSTNEELETQQETLQKTNQSLEEQAERLTKSEEVVKKKNEELKKTTESLSIQSREIEQKSILVEEAKVSIEAKAHDLELANKYKSEFLANMSHELRTPLNSLLILSKIFAKNEEGNLTPEQLESANIIHSGGKDLLALINDILDLSKVEAGQLEMNFESVQISTIIANVRQLFIPVANDKKLKFNIEGGKELQSYVKTDSQRTEQILKNFLSNAFKFTSKGSVSIMVHRPNPNIHLQRDELNHKNCIAISVTDTGIGIPEEKKAIIFEAFQQLDGGTSRTYGGTGLGLSISRELAKILGCEIQLHSEVDKGSTFTLYIPLASQGAFASTNTFQQAGFQKSEMRAEATTSEMNNEKKTLVSASEHFIPDDRELIRDGDKSLLIIEDDKTYGRILMEFAHKRGYKCLVAPTGKSGLEMATQYKPSAITLDINLPDMKGDKVLDQLKSNVETRHIPVHILSVEDETNILCEKGAIGYLQKPSDREELVKIFTKIESISKNKVKKVLVVEDDKSNQKAIADLIDNKDITITFVEEGKKACQKIKKEKFDCIILDLNLPDISGFEVLKRLNKDKSLELPPLIIHTARDLSKDEYKELRAYTSSFVLKGEGGTTRLLDELLIFLHSVESSMTSQQKKV